MVSVSKLQLLSKLSDGTVEDFKPTVSDEGEVAYPETEDLLAHQDGTSIEALDALAGRGFLHKEYTTKVYICPSCQADGLQYITACPFCEDTHTIRTSFFEHEQCGFTAQSEDFEIGDHTETQQCPDCEKEIDSSNITIMQKQLCKGCGESFDHPSHRLWCLDCFYLSEPEKATEQTLYEYELTEKGENWHEAQVGTRELLADEFASRGFDVTLDAALQNDEDGDELYKVHIHATDELLNQRIVADIHSAVDSEKIKHISTVGKLFHAQPLLLATDESISDDVLQIANQHGVTMLWVDQSGSIRRYESIDDEYRPAGNIIDRLSSAVGFTSTKGD
ncbi:hypothetical protein HAPAU_28480 [Halalkalicoccus paucihalophilus]|uniref:Thaumarchaeal output domain-containing protein n=1 Tax=Halalkalicoccus paucihalophilus TaxID=1008153 RepID=A0A151ACC8_9EURY|nr:hypothetical protein [Halalkalicoccus paucihalophilus]KYH25027.1 hypothetical protein HAPAU_28480 [Halalkalicoccus paucihalophilus]